MAKKRGKKTSRTKRVSRTSVSRRKPNNKNNYERKTRLVSRGLVTFVIFFFAALGLYYTSNDAFSSDLFGVTAMITGAISLALIISYITLFLRKRLKK